MKLPFHTIELLKRKSGSDLRLPSQCELLSLDIESRTGVRIGATTLKNKLKGFAIQTSCRLRWVRIPTQPARRYRLLDYLDKDGF